MVSVLLKREGSDPVVKLVHSRVVAGNATEARGAVLREVKSRYAGYAVIDTLTSDLAEKPASCTGRLQLWTKARETTGATA